MHKLEGRGRKESRHDDKVNRKRWLLTIGQLRNDRMWRNVEWDPLSIPHVNVGLVYMSFVCVFTLKELDVDGQRFGSRSHEFPCLWMD